MQLCWDVEDKSFDVGRIELNGSKYLTGNGYMGYRGTLEEYSKGQLVSCILSGVYDRVGDGWREPVNAPNGFLTRLYCDGQLLSVLACEPVKHEQSLDMLHGIHRRDTEFKTGDNDSLRIKSERFVSLDDEHLMCMRYRFESSRDCEIVIETGIDGNVWDINGPHLKSLQVENDGEVISISGRTCELGHTVAVAEAFEFDCGNWETSAGEMSITRRIVLQAIAGVEYSFCKYVCVYTSADGLADARGSAAALCRRTCGEGYGLLLMKHCEKWKERWSKSDVIIEGDDEAQLALRFSIYHLLIISPAHSERVSIPARGLSGQVYKGAVFWDTEMFMLPFFIHTNPDIARNLLKYRCNTLDGARRKAAEYGYRGAFFAWESQDTGDDACTHFNVTDVFTGRPMRTYFRDKQIHISADVAYGIRKYYEMTGDEELLLDGGIETILECARFLYSYSYYKKEKHRYELLDVTGPDEYHERVNNNAFTNMLAKYTLETALESLEFLQGKYPDRYAGLIEKLDYSKDMENIREMCSSLCIQEPDPESLVIEQFDGYHRLEDISLPELRNRIINKNEYLGGGNGLATTTKIIKQADVVLMLNLFKERFPHEVKKANWDYYEPRTEHGSSLSPCVYALLAADIGYADWGYRYFMKTATIDMTGESKQYVGTLYIGGTHPAANGGAWMSAVLGFGGLDADEKVIRFNPDIPSKWESIQFNIIWMSQQLNVQITKSMVKIRSNPENTRPCPINIKGNAVLCGIGQEITAAY